MDAAVGPSICVCFFFALLSLIALRLIDNTLRRVGSNALDVCLTRKANVDWRAHQRAICSAGQVSVSLQLPLGKLALCLKWHEAYAAADGRQAGGRIGCSGHFCESRRCERGGLQSEHIRDEDGT